MFGAAQLLSGLSDRIANRVSQSLSAQLARAAGVANTPGGGASRGFSIMPAHGGRSAASPPGVLDQAMQWFHGRQAAGSSMSRPRAVSMPDVSGMTPQQIVAAHGSAQQQSHSTFGKWAASRLGMRNQMDRAKGLQMRRAAKYQQFASAKQQTEGNVAKFQAVLRRRRDRLHSYPTVGQAGYNPARAKKLLEQVNSAKGRFAGAQAADAAAGGRVASSLSNLSKASAVYATSTNVAAGAMRVLGAVTAKALPIVGWAAAAIGLPSLVSGMASRRLESQRWGGAYDSGMGGVMARSDIATENMKTLTARETGASASRLSDESIRLRRALRPYGVFATNLANDAAAFVAGATATGVGKFGHLVSAVNAGSVMGTGEALVSLMDPFEIEGRIRKALGATDPAGGFGVAGAAAAAVAGGQFSNVFSNTLGAWSKVSDDIDNARFNNRPKDVLKPIR